MNYKKIYDDLIAKAKSENRIKSSLNYYEAHHIIPRCLGGEGRHSQWRTHENLVLLTAREHYVAHKLLCHIYPDNLKLMRAFYAMLTMKSKGRDYRVCSREYQEIRLLISKNMSGANNPIHRIENPFKNPVILEKIRQSRIGFRHSEVTKQKLSQVAKDRVFSDETKLKISESNKGKQVSKETRQKLSLAAKGKKKTQEHIEKMRLSQIGKKNPKTSETNRLMNTMKFDCPHCKRQIGGKANFTRFHNDNCKLKKQTKSPNKNISKK